MQPFYRTTLSALALIAATGAAIAASPDTKGRLTIGSLLQCYPHAAEPARSPWGPFVCRLLVDPDGKPAVQDPPRLEGGILMLGDTWLSGPEKRQ